MKNVALLQRCKSVIIASLRKTVPRRLLSSHQRFLRDGGNQLLVEGFNLGKQSQAVDIGGYLGGWSQKIRDIYGCDICIVEPVPIFFEQIKRRFECCDNVKIFPYLISAQTGTKHLFFSNDGTGFFADGRSVSVESRSVSDFVGFIGRDIIDLLMINIEGGEYELLDLFIEHGVIDRTKHLLIQFHQVAEVSPAEHEVLQLAVSKSHKLVFDYPYVWQRWDLIR